MRYINVALDESAQQALAEVGDQTQRSIPDLALLGLSLVKTLVEETQRGHKLIVTTAEGTPLKELVLPKRR